MPPGPVWFSSVYEVTCHFDSRLAFQTRFILGISVTVFKYSLGLFPSLSIEPSFSIACGLRPSHIGSVGLPGFVPLAGKAVPMLPFLCSDMTSSLPSYLDLPEFWYDRCVSPGLPPTLFLFVCLRWFYLSFECWV